MDESEVSWIRRCQQGEKEAFAPLVRKYAGAASGMAYVLLGCHEEAHDASQEAFVRAWRHIKRFNPAAPFYPWYAAILRNVCLGRMKSRARRKAEALGDGRADVRGDADPALSAERREQCERLWQAILQLPLHHRDVVLMNHFSGMSYREMAETLQIPIGTVMSRLHNARQALRGRLTGEVS